jgi:glycosyltransferase involved in cell wall biosynthesis
MTAKKGETRLSIIIPAKNEAEIIGTVVESVRELHPQAEILVVNDGSDDETGPLAEQSGATVVTHPVSLGNGAAIKSGARAASGDVLVMMDGDGQHKAADIQSLIDKLDSGYSMAIGARDSGSHAGIGRLAANGLYNVFASMISGHRILDLTSGFRAVRADLFKKFLYLLPNGFSYPTTITHSAGQGRPSFSCHHLQGCDPVCAAQGLSSHQRSILCQRYRLLRVHVFHNGPIYEHEHADSQRLGDHFSDRTDFRADYRAHLHEVLRNSSLWPMDFVSWLQYSGRPPFIHSGLPFCGRNATSNAVVLP